jgi:hypothetical protein
MQDDPILKPEWQDVEDPNHDNSCTPVNPENILSMHQGIKKCELLVEREREQRSPETSIPPSTVAWSVLLRWLRCWNEIGEV